MNLNEYQNQAMSFRLPTADESYVTTNLVSEVGEYFGHLAKAIRDETATDADSENQLKQLLIKELGDILWCITAIASDLDSSLDEVATMNVHKLTARKLRGTLQGSGDNR